MEDTAARRNSWFSRSRPRAQLSCSTPQTLLALLSHTLTPLRSPRLASIPVRSRPPSFSRRHCGTRYWNPGNCELAEQTPPSGTPNSVHPRPADTCEPAFPPRLCSGTPRRQFRGTPQKSRAGEGSCSSQSHHKQEAPAPTGAYTPEPSRTCVLQMPTQAHRLFPRTRTSVEGAPRLPCGPAGL